MSDVIIPKPECVVAYDEVKMQKKYRYVIYGFVENDQYIDVIHCGDRVGCTEGLADLLVQFKVWQGRSGHGAYAVFDVEKNNANRIAFIVWTPDSLTVRSKMLLASCKIFFKPKLEGLKAEVQASDEDELTLDILEKAV